MKKPYTCLLPDKPHPPFAKKPASWTPMLKTRIGWRHQKTPRFDAVVDSGSPWCLFRFELADLLGIDTLNGQEDLIGGISEGMQEPVYFHKVQLYIEDNWIIDVTAGFVKKLTFAALLGRNGFFDNFLVTFDHSYQPPMFEINKIEKRN